MFSLSDVCTGVCLRGVKYKLEGVTLTNRFPLGVSNEFEAPEAEISLTEGIMMIVQAKKEKTPGSASIQRIPAFLRYCKRSRTPAALSG